MKEITSLVNISPNSYISKIRELLEDFLNSECSSKNYGCTDDVIIHTVFNIEDFYRSDTEEMKHYIQHVNSLDNLLEKHYEKVSECVKELRLKNLHVRYALNIEFIEMENNIGVKAYTRLQYKKY